jgi:hypothetical protein
MRTSHAKPYVVKQQMQRVVATASKRAGFAIKRGSLAEAKFTTHSLRRLFYNSLQGLEDVDHECLHGHIKSVKARYHGSVDEMTKAIELMRGKYEFGMRAYIAAGNDVEQRKRNICDYARMQGLSEEQLSGIQKTLGMAATAEQLRDAIGQFMGRGNDYEARQTLTIGGKNFNALLVNEKDLVPYLEKGWEIVKELSNGQIAIRRTS